MPKTFPPLGCVLDVAFGPATRIILAVSHDRDCRRDQLLRCHYLRNWLVLVPIKTLSPLVKQSMPKKNTFNLLMYPERGEQSLRRHGILIVRCPESPCPGYSRLRFV